ncbi:MAG: CDC27 family protein [Chitinophagaceae bacterium]
MKKMLLFLFVMGFSVGVKAQDSAAMKKHYLKMYRQGLVYTDLNTGIYALQGYLAIDNNIQYRDTLSMLYYATKNYYSSMLLGKEVYEAMPDNLEAIARTAECYDEMGDPRTAVNLFEKVVPKTKNPYQIYKMAVCLYQLKRTAEAETSARAVLADTSSKKIGINFTSADGAEQAVSLNAAAANLMGVIKMDAGNYTGAKADFQKALSLYPQFTGARQNLDACEKKLKSGAKPKG